MTAGEFREFMGAMMGQFAANFDRDPKEFTRQLGLMMVLARLAEAEKVSEKAPFKQRLEFQRNNTLAQVFLDYKTNTIPITEQDIRARYETMAPSAAEARTKVLFVSFDATGKVRSEADALAKIQKLREQAASGTDFVKLITEHSDDAVSKAKAGDYPAMKRSDSYPEAVKTAIFGLKPGELSAPIRQPSGFYLFRLESLTLPTLEQMRDQVALALRQEKFAQWFQGVRQEAAAKIEFRNEEFFRPKTVAPAVQGLPGMTGPGARPATPPVNRPPVAPGKP